MILREAVDRPLLANLPLPLAQAWRRILYQETAADVHDRALYALEAMLKYTASMAVTAWVARGAEGEAGRRACAALVKPSLGHWTALLRTCAAALPHDDPLRRYLERVRGAAVEAGVEGLAGRQVGDIFEALPAYRNQVAGHGAGLSATVTADRAPTLAALARSVLAAAVGQQAPILMGRAGTQFVQLMGPTAVVEASGQAPGSGSLFIRLEGRTLPLSPLWIFDVEEDDVLVLNKGAGLAKVEYLSYGSPRGSSGLVVLKGPAAAAAKSFLESATGQSHLGGADVAALIEETEVSELANHATDRRFGPYRVVRKVAEGGQGVLYEAIQESPPRRVALKTLSLDRAVMEESQRRLREEATAIARVEHPNIVPVYETGDTDGVPWIAMKFVEGKSLAEVVDALRRHAGPVTLAEWRAATETLADRPETEQPRSYPERVAELTREAARALAACHAQGIIHRDVKPGNLMLDGEGRIILTDFGLARSMEARPETFTRKLVGTLQYLAPEALLPAGRKGPDARVDVYGLGATLYELLSLHAPFDNYAQDEGALLHAVQTKDPLPLRRVAAWVPRDLETVVMKALEKDRDRRYPTITEFADDLDRYLKGVPIRARPPGVIARTWKWARRHPGKAVGVVATVVATVLVAVGLSLWLRADMKEREARQKQRIVLDKDDELTLTASNDHWKHSRYKEAADVLDQEVQRLDKAGDPELAQRMAERKQKAAEARQLANSFAFAEMAHFLLGEEKDQDALDACEAGLRELGILTAGGEFTQKWWLHLPKKDLSTEQIADLQNEVYRQVLLLAFLRLKQGGNSYSRDPAVSEASFRSCLEILDQIRELEHVLGIRPARVTKIWRKLCVSFLQFLGKPVNPGYLKAAEELFTETDLATEAENSPDYYLLGVAHFLAWKASSHPLIFLVKVVLKNDLDLKTPLDTSERYLRAAIQLEAKQYWPRFMLGWTLASKGDYRGAELVFGSCISLKPTNPRGYEWRALSLINQVPLEKEETRKQELRRRALADSAESLRLAPHDPSAWWPRGDLLKELGQASQALDAYARAMELEDDLLQKLSRVHGLDIAAEYANDLLKKSENDSAAQAIRAQAYVVLALVHLTRQTDKDDAQARAAATSALAVSADDAAATAVRSRAFAVLGTVKWRANQPAAALKDFQKSMEENAGNFMAVLGEARVYEKQREDEKALATYDYLLNQKLPDGQPVAAAPWQALEAHLGRYRMLRQLGRENEARAALEEARKINPRAAKKAEPAG